MSYSRRQLYAMGETFGDSATRKEVGGRIVYGGGGGGGNKTVEPTTTITESGPTITNRTTANEIPNYLTDASQDLVARGQALTNRPYEAYTGARVAEFSPLMNQAFGRMGSQQVAGQTTEATGLASLAGQRAMDYGQFQQGVQQYMNPYMQNVVDIERRKAQEAADQQAAALSGQAVRQGAFGGSGAALQQRALRRDTAQQLADLQAQGLDRAYQSAVGQYNQGISSGLAASSQLAGLGQQQFGQEMDITKGLGTAGDVQRQREQALLDVGYGDYLTAQKYPYEQLAFQQSLVSGVPYSTTQRTSEVSQPGKQVSQKVSTTEAAAAQGGEIRRYADGGITSLLSDQQIDQHQLMPNISDLARMALQAKKEKYAQIRADQQNMDAQQAMMDRGPEETVAGDVMRQIAAARASGIAGLDDDMPEDFLVGDEYTAAGGGIVAFQNLGAVPAPTDPYDNRFRGAGPILGNTSNVGIGQFVPGARQTPPAGPEIDRRTRVTTPPAPSAQKRSSMVDDIYGPIETEMKSIGEADRKALEAVEKDIKAEAEEGNSFTAKARERIEARLKGLEGEDKNIAENSILQFGFGFLIASGEKNKRKALAELGLNTIKGNSEAVKALQAKQERYEDASLEIDKIEMGERRATRKELRDLQLQKAQAETGVRKSMVNILGERGKTIFDMYKLDETNRNALRVANVRGGAKGELTQAQRGALMDKANRTADAEIDKDYRLKYSITPAERLAKRNAVYQQLLNAATGQATMPPETASASAQDPLGLR